MSTSIDIGSIRKKILFAESKIKPLNKRLLNIEAKKEMVLKKFEESRSKIDLKISALQTEISERKELFSCNVNLEIPIIFTFWNNWSEAEGDPHWRSQDNSYDKKTDILVIKSISIFFQKKAEQRSFYKKENVYLSLITEATDSQKFSEVNLGVELNIINWTAAHRSFSGLNADFRSIESHDELSNVLKKLRKVLR